MLQIGRKRLWAWPSARAECCAFTTGSRGHEAMCARWLGAPMSRGREKGAAQQPVHSPIRWILLLGTVGWSNIKTDQAWTFCC